jgi:HsdM N-terminal domain
VALKKSELYSSLWSSCDELRGGMDASQYKDYVLVLLFIKYVSDKYAGQPYAPITIPPGASFDDMVATSSAARASATGCCCANSNAVVSHIGDARALPSQYVSHVMRIPQLA